MKPFTVEIEIALPRDQVIELFDNPDMFRRQNLRFMQNFKEFAEKST